jgi:predicted alpha/beta-hydrolase family hydrolase
MNKAGPESPQISALRPMTNTARERRWKVAVGDEETTAVFQPAAAPLAGAVFVCAHGAGGHLADRGMLQVAEGLGKIGLGVVRFNFLYREMGNGRPDPMPRLQACFSAVVERVRAEIHPPILLIGGRSMGGRAASMLAAEGYPCDGLLLLAYPLHPAGQPEKLRSAHLERIPVPVLCFNGTRDNLCRPDLMEGVVRRLGPVWTMHWLESADHGFHATKSSGRTDSEVLAEIAVATRGWLEGLLHKRSVQGGGVLAGS